jgi:hypothetical protein
VYGDALIIHYFHYYSEYTPSSREQIEAGKQRRRFPLYRSRWPARIHVHRRRAAKWMCLADFGKFHAAMTKVIFGANIVFLFVVVTGSGC